MDEMNLWLTPLILLPGVGLLIMSTSARFNRLHDEVHEMMHHAHTPPEVSAGLLQRGRLFRNALVGLYVCVALFAAASLLGMLAALWESEDATWLVLGITAGGVLCLMCAALLLIRESILSMEIIEAHGRQGDAAHAPHEH